MVINGDLWSSIRSWRLFLHSDNVTYFKYYQAYLRRTHIIDKLQLQTDIADHITSVGKNVQCYPTSVCACVCVCVCVSVASNQVTLLNGLNTQQYGFRLHHNCYFSVWSPLILKKSVKKAWSRANKFSGVWQDKQMCSWNWVAKCTYVHEVLWRRSRLTQACSLMCIWIIFLSALLLHHHYAHEMLTNTHTQHTHTHTQSVSHNHMYICFDVHRSLHATHTHMHTHTHTHTHTHAHTHTHIHTHTLTQTHNNTLTCERGVFGGGGGGGGEMTLSSLELITFTG